MSTENGDLPAVPKTEVFDTDGRGNPIPCQIGGLTKREYFALHALGALELKPAHGDYNVKARASVMYADALLKELEK